MLDEGWRGDVLAWDALEGGAAKGDGQRLERSRLQLLFQFAGIKKATTPFFGSAIILVAPLTPFIGGQYLLMKQ